MRDFRPFDCPVLESANRAHPLSVVDVGAAGGLDPVWADFCADGYGHGYGFEPFPENFAKLVNSKTIKYFPFAISDQVGEADFYGGSTVGSLMPREDREQLFRESFIKIRVRTETLANLLESGALLGLDVLKVDVEGAESAVLRGAGRFLDDLLYVKAEFSFDPSKGNALSDIDKVLVPHGLRLFDFAANYTAYRALSGGDVLYLKDVFSLLRSGRPKDQLRVLILKLVIIALMNNYYEYAFICVQAGLKNGVVEPEEGSVISKFCTSLVYLPHLVGPLPAQLALNRVLFNFSHLFARRGTDKSVAKDNRLQKSPRLWSRSAILNRLFRSKNEAYWKHVHDRAFSNGP